MFVPLQPDFAISTRGDQHNPSKMIREYSQKRSKEEIIEGFKQAVRRKNEWLAAHNMNALVITDTEA